MILILAAVGCHSPRPDSGADEHNGRSQVLMPTTEVYVDALLDVSGVWEKQRACLTGESGTTVCKCEHYLEMLCRNEPFSEATRLKYGGAYVDCQVLMLFQAFGVTDPKPADPALVVQQLAESLVLDSFPSSLHPGFGPGALGTPSHLAQTRSHDVTLHLTGDMLALERENAVFEIHPMFKLDLDGDGLLELGVRLVEVFDVGSYCDDRLLILKQESEGWKADPQILEVSLRPDCSGEPSVPY